MSLATYADLKAAIAGWLRRTDLEGLIPDFIVLAEAQMNRRLRARRRILRADSTIEGEYLSLPDDFAGVRTFRVLDGGCRTALKAVTPEQMAGLKSGRLVPTGTPTAYTVIGPDFEFDRITTEPLACEIAYVQRLAPLSSEVEANWVLEAHPDAYLYGALLQSAPYLKADERVSVWAQLFATVLDDINGDSLAESLGGALAPTPAMATV